MSDVQQQECNQVPAYAIGLDEHQIRALQRRGKVGKRARVLELQRVLYARALLAESPNETAACSRAYDVLEDRSRVLDGKLKAGSVNESRKCAETKSDSGLTSFGK